MAGTSITYDKDMLYVPEIRPIKAKSAQTMPMNNTTMLARRITALSSAQFRKLDP
jgi:hypothetical protein